MEVVNLAEKGALIDAIYEPRILAALNGQYVKLVRFDGPYVWHDHADQDELFLVVEGEIRIELRDRVAHLKAGEFFVVPRGVEHRPVADAPATVLLFEPMDTVNTGDVDHDYTLRPDQLESI